MSTVLLTVAVRHDQDWVGFAVVMGILVLSLHAWFRYQHVETGARDMLASLRAADPGHHHPGPDHVDCSNPDCDHTICACRKPAECTGTTTLGCPHGEGLCWGCRLGCSECAAEEQALSDLDWANGR